VSGLGLAASHYGLQDNGFVTAELQQEIFAPRSELEDIRVQLWGAVLTADQIGINHNFFGLVGDSLAAGRLVASINSRFDLDIPVSVVFEAPPVTAQAVLVESALLDQIEDGPA
jgi:acyl carrier protein